MCETCPKTCTGKTGKVTQVSPSLTLARFCSKENLFYTPWLWESLIIFKFYACCNGLSIWTAYFTQSDIIEYMWEWFRHCAWFSWMSDTTIHSKLCLDHTFHHFLSFHPLIQGLTDHQVFSPPLEWRCLLMQSVFFTTPIAVSLAADMVAKLVSKIAYS